MVKRLLQGYRALCDAVFGDWLAKWVFGLKVFFYTFAGALIGGAVERGAGTVASIWRNEWVEFVFDVLAYVFIILAGVCLALIGKEIEVTDMYVERRDDNDELSPEELRQYQEEQEEGRYATVKASLLGAVLFLFMSVGLLVGGNRPMPGTPHPRIEFRCSPCVIEAGQSTRLIWEAAGATKAFLDNERVSLSDSREVWPGQSTAYQLRVVTLYGNGEMTVSVTVEEGPDITATPGPSSTITGELSE